MKNKCLLAYSGGLDTSAIIPWLKKNLNLEVIAYCCNVGNLPPKEELKKRALDLGAHDFIYEEVQEEFASRFVFPLLKANATYLDDYLLGTAIARPIIALKMAEQAKTLGASILVHGATGKGNDHLRFEKAWAFLCPDAKIIAPWKIWNFKGREDLVCFLKSVGYTWPNGKNLYSVDLNVFHRSCEGGELEDIDVEYSSATLQWISPQYTNTSEKLLLFFEKGDLKKINGKLLTPLQALEVLNSIGAKYGIGLCDLVEERSNGLKSRGLYETPGGTLIQRALTCLKQICWERELFLEASNLGSTYGKLIYDGHYFNDLRKSLDAFFHRASEKLTGEIILGVTWKSISILSRKSPYSLYNSNLVSFESDTMDINQAALGFTHIKTLSDKQAGKAQISYEHTFNEN